MHSDVDGVPVVILADAEGEPSLAYHRALTDGTVLDFERSDDGAVRDEQTGSRWTSSGLAVDGELAGRPAHVRDIVPQRVVRLGRLPPRHED